MTRPTLVAKPGSPRDVHGFARGPSKTLPPTCQSHASLNPTGVSFRTALPGQIPSGLDSSYEVCGRSARGSRARGQGLLPFRGIGLRTSALATKTSCVKCCVW